MQIELIFIRKTRFSKKWYIVFVKIPEVKMLSCSHDTALPLHLIALKQPGVTRQPKVVIIVGSISSRVRSTLRRGRAPLTTAAGNRAHH